MIIHKKRFTLIHVIVCWCLYDQLLLRDTIDSRSIINFLVNVSQNLFPSESESESISSLHLDSIN